MEQLLESVWFVARSAWTISPAFLLSVSLGALKRALKLDGVIKRAFDARVSTRARYGSRGVRPALLLHGDPGRRGTAHRQRTSRSGYGLLGRRWARRFSHSASASWGSR